MTSIVRQYSTTKVRRESAADFSSRLQLNVPEITIMSHRPSFVDINSEVTRSRTNSRINITRRVTDIPQRANAANESPSFDNNGEENADRDRSTSITLNAEDDVADHVMFGSGELNVHLDTLTWINAPWKLSALVFITLEIEESSSFAKYLGIFLKLVIILAIAGYVLSTLPALRVYPTVCDVPDCNDDPILCPGYMVCQDETNDEFNLIEDWCTYIFTVEWGFKFLTCWSVTPRVAGILPSSWEEENEETPDAVQPHYSLPYTMFKWTIQFKNMIDLASIVPFYVQLASSSGNQTSFLRVLRLFRIIKILRLLRLLSFLKNVDVAAQIIWATLAQGSLILSVFSFFIIIFVLFFGCIVYLAEQGNWTVSEEFPNGEYLRINKDLTGMEVSPFTDILTGCFWVIGTATGDCPLETTTPQGRVIQSIVMIVGILSLAFPIGVIGSELDRAYRSHYYTLVQKAEERQKRLLGAAKELETPTRNDNIHDVDTSTRGSGSRMKDKLLASARNSSSLSTIAEQSQKGGGERDGDMMGGSMANFAKLPPLRSSQTDTKPLPQQQQHHHQQTQQQQPQPQPHHQQTASTLPTPPSPSHPPHSSETRSYNDRRTQGADVNNYAIHQEDIHIHDLQEMQRATLKHVASAYLTQHDPSDMTETHHTTSAHPTTSSHPSAVHSPAFPSFVSSLFKSGDTHTIVNNNIHTDMNTIHATSDPHNNTTTNQHPTPTPTTAQPVDLTTHVHELIGHARVDVAHAHHRLQTLLLLEATLKKEGRGNGQHTIPQANQSTLSTHSQVTTTTTPTTTTPTITNTNTNTNTTTTTRTIHPNEPTEKDES